MHYLLNEALNVSFRYFHSWMAHLPNFDTSMHRVGLLIHFFVYRLMDAVNSQWWVSSSVAFGTSQSCFKDICILCWEVRGYHVLRLFLRNLAPFLFVARRQGLATTQTYSQISNSFAEFFQLCSPHSAFTVVLRSKSTFL